MNDEPIPSGFNRSTRLPIECPVCRRTSNTVKEYMREHVRRHLRAWMCIICEQNPASTNQNQGQSGSVTDFRSHWRHCHEHAFGPLGALSFDPCRVQYGEELELKSQVFFGGNLNVPTIKELY